MYGTDFIIHDLDANIDATLGEMLHNGVLGCNRPGITPILEGSMQSCIGATVVGNSNVLVATARPKRENGHNSQCTPWRLVLPKCAPLW